MIQWDQVKRALHHMLVVSSGLPVNKVIWSRQPKDAPRPPVPMIDFAIMSIVSRGQDYNVVVDNPDSTGSDGRELIVKTRGQREMTVTIRYFGDMEDVATTPEFELNNIVARSFTDSVNYALNNAGIGVAAWSPILSIDGIVGARFEARAQTEMRAFISSQVEEYTTYIERVGVTLNLEDAGVIKTFEFDVPEP